MKAERLFGRPIILPHMDARMGDNINGPSLIRVPAWVPNPLGKYYLYFAHHRGTYIRLAWANDLAGPWKTYEPGVLDLSDTPFEHHIASPDVHIDEERQQVRMYYHGRVEPGVQRSRVAVSSDGLHFRSISEVIGSPYLRVCKWKGWHYALGMPGVFYRSQDGLTAFTQGPTLFTPNMRHSALMVEDDLLYVFYTNAYECPETIKVATIKLTDDWMGWQTSQPEVVLAPEMDYEGRDAPLEASARGPIMGKVRQLRDPAIFQEDGRVYLLYSVAGESGIAVAKLVR
jgi:hypothetical protein